MTRKANAAKVKMSTSDSSQLILLSLIVALVVISLSLWFAGNQTQSSTSVPVKKSSNSPLDVLFDQLVVVSESAPLQLKKAAIGYNSNLDLVAGALTHLFASSPTSSSSPSPIPSLSPSEVGRFTPVDHPRITNVQQLLETFAYFFQQGIAAERFVEDGVLFQQIVEFILGQPKTTKYTDDITSSPSPPPYQLHPGGNAALMANRFASLGTKVLLGGPIGPRLSERIHTFVLPVSLFLRSFSKPTVALNNDEVHLILEFEKGAKWSLGTDENGNERVIATPRANRFIISHDTSNSNLKSMKQFHESVQGFKPHLIVIAGTHLVEGVEPSETRTQLISDVVKSLETSRKQLPSIPIHLELASIGDSTFYKGMIRSLLPSVDSLGLNEQELLALYSVAADLLRTPSPSKPTLTREDFGSLLRVSTMNSALSTIIQWIHQKDPKTGDEFSRLSRIHLHSLGFHAICQRNGSASAPSVYSWSWSRAKAAVAAGLVATTLQACGEGASRPDSDQLEAFPEAFSQGEVEAKVEGLSLSQVWIGDFGCWVGPVVACKVPIRTVGLGDTISATGLAIHYGST